MTRVLYIYQGDFPHDVRAEKIGRELLRRGCAVTVLARRRAAEPAEAESGGLRVVRVGSAAARLRPLSLPLPGNPLWSGAIRELVDSWRPDLVLAREILLAEPAAAACRRRDLPLLIDMAEHYPAALRTWDKYRRRAWTRFLVCQSGLPELVERRAVARADGVLVVCAEQARRLHRTYGYPAERLAVVHNTPELEAFAAVRAGATRPVRVFAHHGYMTSQRGLDRLVRGFALAARADPEIRLVLAGGATAGLAEALQALARAEGVAERVRLTGPYRPADLVGLYSETDVGVVAYPADESLEHTISNKVFDYMACGKPVLVTPLGPYRRVVEEAGAGLVLAGDDPAAIAAGIARLRQLDPEPLARAAQAAARAQYHWGRDAEELARFLGRYARLAAAQPARAGRDPMVSAPAAPRHHTDKLMN
jgi:glycosyltransferase involved in cell wall biosynthesis